MNAIKWKGNLKFAKVHEKMGEKVTWTKNSMIVTGPPLGALKGKCLHGIDVNMNKMPDIAMNLIRDSEFHELLSKF